MNAKDLNADLVKSLSSEQNLLFKIHPDYHSHFLRQSFTDSAKIKQFGALFHTSARTLPSQTMLSLKLPKSNNVAVRFVLYESLGYGGCAVLHHHVHSYTALGNGS